MKMQTFGKNPDPCSLLAIFLPFFVDGTFQIRIILFHGFHLSLAEWVSFFLHIFDLFFCIFFVFFCTFLEPVMPGATGVQKRASKTAKMSKKKLPGILTGLALHG